MPDKSSKSGKTSMLQRRGLLKEDYYLNEKGLMVFTEHYHLKRGYCCKSGCLHCPYGFTRKPVEPESE
ncbi:DUF5522 domain-containing protein [Telluribacter sp. SYSU D00476]|uniref:DUF5522 domain-containing protein n=1 Tax=Telluribacter sp. SYSU D00476 TaxID=2811430 RepID=UPI001FF54863|nr:DUF5522 domain-containing protein [Telluribacter sp. SYSU D00476]